MLAMFCVVHSRRGGKAESSLPTFPPLSQSGGGLPLSPVLLATVRLRTARGLTAGARAKFTGLLVVGVVTANREDNMVLALFLWPYVDCDDSP
jgi:hypothetical protein